MAESSDDPILVALEADIAHLVPMYLANRRRDVANITEMLGRQGYAELQEMGHNLHGQGSTYGCHGITDIGRLLEAAAQRQDDADIRRQATALGHYLRRVKLVAQ